MKKTIILLTSLILIVTFTACSREDAEFTSEISNASEINEVESGGEISNISENPVTLSTDYENAVPLEMQIILGTIKLDETEYSISADQAVELLPLWKAARSLIQSDTAAAEETEAIFNQISKIMTSEQLESIVAMQLSQNDVVGIAESLGIEMSSSGKFGNLTTEEIAATQAARGGGQGLPDSGDPGAGPAGGQPRGSAPSRNQGAGSASRITDVFYDVIIEMLEARVQ